MLIFIINYYDVLTAVAPTFPSPGVIPLPITRVSACLPRKINSNSKVLSELCGVSATSFLRPNVCLG